MAELLDHDRFTLHRSGWPNNGASAQVHRVEADARGLVADVGIEVVVRGVIGDFS